MRPMPAIASVPCYSDLISLHRRRPGTRLQYRRAGWFAGESCGRRTTLLLAISVVVFSSWSFFFSGAVEVCAFLLPRPMYLFQESQLRFYSSKSRSACGLFLMLLRSVERQSSLSRPELRRYSLLPVSSGAETHLTLSLSSKDSTAATIDQDGARPESLRTPSQRCRILRMNGGRYRPSEPSALLAREPVVNRLARVDDGDRRFPDGSLSRRGGRRAASPV
jgi:hypothetical protein